MNSTLRRRALVPLLLLTLLALPATAQEADLAAKVTFDGPEGSNTMNMRLGAEHVRLDMGSPQGDASMVWGPSSMLMIMHSQQMYMEFDEQMMERMRQMQGAMGQNSTAEEDDFDPADYSFETTGNSDSIAGLAAFEVLMTGPDGSSGKMWLSTEASVGLFEVMSRMADKLSAVSLGGNNNPMGDMQRYMGMARAQGLPEGKVLRFVDDENGATITLEEATPTSFDATTWAAPDGYTKRQMPGMPR